MSSTPFLIFRTTRLSQRLGRVRCTEPHEPRRGKNDVPRRSTLWDRGRRGLPGRGGVPGPGSVSAVTSGTSVSRLDVVLTEGEPVPLRRRDVEIIPTPHLKLTGIGVLSGPATGIRRTRDLVSSARPSTDGTGFRVTRPHQRSDRTLDVEETVPTYPLPVNIRVEVDVGRLYMSAGGVGRRRVTGGRDSGSPSRCVPLGFCTTGRSQRSPRLKREAGYIHK